MQNHKRARRFIKGCAMEPTPARWEPPGACLPCPCRTYKHARRQGAHWPAALGLSCRPEWVIGEGVSEQQADHGEASKGAVRKGGGTWVELMFGAR